MGGEKERKMSDAQHQRSDRVGSTARPTTETATTPNDTPATVATATTRDNNRITRRQVGPGPKRAEQTNQATGGKKQM